MQQFLGLCPPAIGDLLEQSVVPSTDKLGLETDGMDVAVFGDWLLDFETGHEESIVGAGA